MKQNVFLGFNTITNVEKILKEHSPKNIFIVTGKLSYKKQKIISLIRQQINPYNVTYFSDFSPNPEIKDVLNGVVKYKNHQCDFVIAIGGGSAIDTAKAINILSYNKEHPLVYSRQLKHISRKGAPLIAIPTTSGSGSEATKFSSLYDNKIKCSLNHKYLLPDYVIVDPQLSLTLPPYISACTGIDALTQAIESHWCIDSTNESKKFSKKAIELIMNNISDAVHRPTIQIRGQMAEAAFLAGKAINITRTTACHRIASPITTHYGLPHGNAVGLTLAPMIIFNGNVNNKESQDLRGVDYVINTINEIANLIGSDSIYGASQKISLLLENIGLKTRLSEVGIKTTNDITKIIQGCYSKKKFNNNPRFLSETSLRYEILDKIK